MSEYDKYLEDEDSSDEDDQTADETSEDEDSADEDDQTADETSEDEDSADEDIKKETKRVESTAQTFARIIAQKSKSKVKVQENYEATELGAKPTLEDYAYDAEAYGSALDAWYENKQKIDKADSKKKSVEAVYNKKKAVYESTGASLKNFDTCRALVEDVIDERLMSELIYRLDDPAKFVHTIGTHPKLLEKLVQSEDPLDFIVEAKSIERAMRSRNFNKSKRNKPDLVPASSGGGVTNGQREKRHCQNLYNKAVKEAAKTGVYDFTEYHAAEYERRQKEYDQFDRKGV